MWEHFSFGQQGRFAWGPSGFLLFEPKYFFPSPGLLPLRKITSPRKFTCDEVVFFIREPFGQCRASSKLQNPEHGGPQSSQNHQYTSKTCGLVHHSLGGSKMFNYPSCVTRRATSSSKKIRVSLGLPPPPRRRWVLPSLLNEVSSTRSPQEN